MINLFCGYDPREAIGFHVFVHSVISRASQPVSIITIGNLGLREGSNAFTVSRFMIPFLMGFKGHAIFADASDMLMLGDVAELDALFDPAYAVQVVKHDYKTKHRIKYRGTPMECPNLDYPRKNWASLMIVNCEHQAWKTSTPDVLSQVDNLSMLRLENCDHYDEVGELPNEWNRLVDEGQPVEDAKLMHWTAGIPAFDCYADAPGAGHWHAERALMETFY